MLFYSNICSYPTRIDRGDSVIITVTKLPFLIDLQITFYVDRQSTQDKNRLRHKIETFHGILQIVNILKKLLVKLTNRYLFYCKPVSTN